MPHFDKQWKDAGLSDDDLKDLEIFLCEHPDAGAVIQGAGGLRKLRWSIPGQGKSGGVRTLYVDFTAFGQIHMITCFRKSNKENLSTSEKNRIKSLIDQIKENLKR